MVVVDSGCRGGGENGYNYSGGGDGGDTTYNYSDGGGRCGVVDKDDWRRW